jgi:hypothetical protein
VRAADWPSRSVGREEDIARASSAKPSGRSSVICSGVVALASGNLSRLAVV